MTLKKRSCLVVIWRNQFFLDSSKVGLPSSCNAKQLTEPSWNVFTSKNVSISLGRIYLELPGNSTYVNSEAVATKEARATWFKCLSCSNELGSLRLNGLGVSAHINAYNSKYCFIKQQYRRLHRLGNCQDNVLRRRVSGESELRPKRRPRYEIWLNICRRLHHYFLSNVEMKIQRAFWGYMVRQ